MTLFFNLKYLEEISKGNTFVFVDTLRIYYYNLLPSSKDVKFHRKLMVGKSFILNPKPLFNLISTHQDYLVQYIKLAARRDYWLYKQYETKTLQLSYFPDLNLEVLITNPLLKITKTEIFFYYEENLKEIKNGTIIR